MTRAQAIEEACSIVSMAYHSIHDYREPSDGFCEACRRIQGTYDGNYQNAGKALAYVKRAVRNQLVADGYQILNA